jgi:two-component system, cell cycle sensor histidine kinase and response regulator CckA
VTAVRGAAPLAHVLVVDDEPTVRRYAARVLMEEGYLVREASDGAEALRMLGEPMGEVDVVVSDVVMPRVNGVELLQQLSASHPLLPVILMSGYAPAELNGMGIAAPCGVLTKPFAPERLVGEVRRCLQGSDPTTTEPERRAV